MANQSIYNAFERMWQHVVAALGNKANISDLEDLRQDFQDGCDTIVSGCTAHDVTPTSNSPADIVEAIDMIYNKGAEAGNIINCSHICSFVSWNNAAKAPGVYDSAYVKKNSNTQYTALKSFRGVLQGFVYMRDGASGYNMTIKINGTNALKVSGATGTSQGFKEVDIKAGDVITFTQSSSMSNSCVSGSLYISNTDLSLGGVYYLYNAGEYDSTIFGEYSNLNATVTKNSNNYQVKTSQGSNGSTKTGYIVFTQAIPKSYNKISITYSSTSTVKGYSHSELNAIIMDSPSTSSNALITKNVCSYGDVSNGAQSNTKTFIGEAIIDISSVKSQNIYLAFQQICQNECNVTTQISKVRLLDYSE